MIYILTNGFFIKKSNNSFSALTTKVIVVVTHKKGEKIFYKFILSLKLSNIIKIYCGHICHNL